MEGRAPDAVKVNLLRSEGAVAAVVEAPEGWKATTTQPQSGGDAGMKIADSSGKSVEVPPHGDATVRWGVTATFSTGFLLEAEGSDCRSVELQK